MWEVCECSLFGYLSVDEWYGVVFDGNMERVTRESIKTTPWDHNLGVPGSAIEAFVGWPLPLGQRLLAPHFA